MKIAFLGFGEAGQAFARTLGGERLAYDIRGDELAPAATALGVSLGGPEGLSAADVVISAVTAAVSQSAAEAIATHLNPSQLFIDINSVSPGRKQATAAALAPTGVRYLDMAVMGPVASKGHQTEVLIAGADAAARDFLTTHQFAFTDVGDEVGRATGIKLVRSLFVKGLEAITVSSLAAAEAAGCRDYVTQSLARSYPGLGWPGFAEYQTERVTTHGRRRAEEMRECGVAMTELGLAPAARLAVAIADVQAETAAKRTTN